VFNSRAWFNVVAMNMIMTESVPLLEKCRSMLERKGLLIWSGILYDEKERAVAAAARAGFSIIRDIFEHEWWCGTFQPGFS
jgi:ribosomal protein L11 methylase PrmA